MNKISPAMEAELEAKLIKVNKADMKLHLARKELRDSICDVICSILPPGSDKDEISKAAACIEVYKVLEIKEKKTVINTVWNILN